jgi:hypothetical protein
MRTSIESMRTGPNLVLVSSNLAQQLPEGQVHVWTRTVRETTLARFCTTHSALLASIVITLPIDPARGVEYLSGNTHAR